MANQPTGNQVLIELPNGEWRLEEVLEVRPLHLTLAYRGASHILAPGRMLSLVRVFSEGTCVLICGARVASSEPTERPGIFRVGLDLLVAQVPADEEERHGAAIAQAVAALVQARARATLTIDGVALAQQAMLTGIHGEPKGLVVELQGAAKPWRPFAVCELSCELFGKRIVLLCKLRSQGSGRRGITELYLDWPHALKASRRRAAQRVKALPQNMGVQARLPFADRSAHFQVADLSSRGFAFEATPDDLITVGMVLPSLDLRLPHGNVRGRGVVRNVRSQGSKVAVGVALQDLSPAGERTLNEFVDAHTSPNLRAARSSDLPQLWSLYKEVGLLDPAAPTRHLRHIEATRIALLTRGQQLLVQMVVNNGEEIAGSAELLRVGERTWRLQQIALRPGSPYDLNTLLQPLVQAALRRSDVGYLQILQPFSRDLDTLQILAAPTQLSLRRWAWVTGAPGPLDGDLSDETHEATSDDRQWVISRLQRLFPPLEHAALDFGPRQLLLAETARLYRVASLECHRQVRLATSISETLGFALVDVGLPGPRGYGTTLTRLFAVGQQVHGRRAALLTLVRDIDATLRALGQVPGFLVNLDDVELLQGGTFTRRGTCLEMVVERSLFGEVPRLMMQVMDTP